MSDLGPLLRHPLPDERLEEFFSELVGRLMEVWERHPTCRGAVLGLMDRIREFEAEFLDPFGEVE